MAVFNTKYDGGFLGDFIKSIFSALKPLLPLKTIPVSVSPKNHSIPIIQKPQELDNKKMLLSKNFTFNELTATSNVDLLDKNRKEAEQYMVSLTKVATDLLQPIRDGLGKSMTINSGFRGKTLNESVGGSKTSQHCMGEAADFNVFGYTSREKQIEVIKWIRDESNIKFRQLLLERGCIHISLPNGNGDGEIAEYDVESKTKKPIKF